MLSRQLKCRRMAELLESCRGRVGWDRQALRLKNKRDKHERLVTPKLGFGGFRGEAVEPG